MFCDHGADMSVTSLQGFTPLIYAGVKGFDEICMYLCLRTKNVDQEDNNGKTVFIMYMLKNDTMRCKQLLMRGANINHVNKDFLTPLHFAIENELPEKMIKFLLNAGANPCIVDKNGKNWLHLDY